jgi:hypothetical protein
MWLETRTLAFHTYLASFYFDGDGFFLGGLNLGFPLGNNILMKMWQHSMG